MDGNLNNEGHRNDSCNQVRAPFSSFWQLAKNSLLFFFFWYFTCWIMLYMISSHILLVNCFYCCSFSFCIYWLNYSIHDFRATGAPLDRKTWIHLNQNIWMIQMMMIGCQSLAALAVKTLPAKQRAAHAELLEVVVGLCVFVYLGIVPTVDSLNRHDIKHLIFCCS